MNAHIVTKLDIWSQYNRIGVGWKDEWKSAFHFRSGYFEYEMMRFGVVDWPATFQDYIN